MARSVFVCAMLALALQGCSFFGSERPGGYFEDDGPPLLGGPDPASVPDPIPRIEPLSKTGNAPYEVYGVRYRPVQEARGYRETGVASWYGKKFHGRKTSSGEIYDMHAMTAAHKTLPLPTYLRVYNLDNGNEVVVRVNDRGPFLGGRVLDLSYMAARKLGLVATGTARVRIEAVDAVSPASAPVQEVTLAPGGGQVLLQAGSFRLSGNAQKLRRRLEDAGIRPVRVATGRVGNDLYYRVQVGPVAAGEMRMHSARVHEVIGVEPTVVSDCC